MTPLDVVTEARTWVGVPFYHQGRARTGIDCLGLPVVVASALGLLPPGFVDKSNYGRSPNSREFLDTVERLCTRIEKPELGCLAMFKWPQTKDPAHIAILDGLYMIHSYQRDGVVSRVSYGQPWLRLTYSLYRFPGVA